jgi:hypothetical protein
MTSEELTKLRADLADLDARRTHDHDDPVRLANPLVAMFDEATVRKLLDALDEATKRAEAAEARATAVVSLERLDRVLREYPDADVSRLAVSADEALRVEDRLRDMQKSRRRWIDAISYGLGVEVQATADEAGEAVAKLRRERDEARDALRSWEVWDAEHHGGVRAYVAALEADQRRLVVTEQDAAQALADLAEARSQLAALCAAASLLVAVQGREESRIARAMGGVNECLANLATATAEHDARVRADERGKALREGRSPCCNAAIRCGRCGHDLAHVAPDKAEVSR